VVAGQETDPSQAVLVPIPYRWTAAGPQLAASDAADFYDDTYLPGLRQEIGRNPFSTRDPRQAKYQANRERAAAMVAELLGRPVK
jgi:hypothetical protein